MEKRAFVAVLLSVAVLIAYQYFVISPKMKEQEAIEEARQKALPKPAPKAQINESPAAAPLIPVETTGAKEAVIKVSTPLYLAEFSTKGAVIRSFLLKNYKNVEGQDIVITRPNETTFPLSIGRTQRLEYANAIFAASVDNIELNGPADKKTLVLDTSDKDVRIRRTITFYGDTYKIDIKDEFFGLNESFISIGNGFDLNDKESQGDHIGPVILEDLNRISINPAKDLDAPKSYKEGVKWIAQENKYFFIALVPLASVKEAVAWKDGLDSTAAIHSDIKVNDYVLYAGPKQQDYLKPLNLSLEHIVDFGFFSIIAKPIFWLLKAIERYIGNYGWSIIILTLVLRVPFIPIISKGQKSMKKLQKLQPKMNEIKERFKKDPARMQQEMMELYRKHKVNPMGSCLPMIVQIPVFFALYKVLLVAIELRRAPFILWILDLSAKDPYYVFPIVMGATMFIQQKMTPSGMDPRQARLMLMMPVIFTFMFLNFSSGLVVYWLVSNLLSIAQQLYINKFTGASEE